MEANSAAVAPTVAALCKRVAELEAELETMRAKVKLLDSVTGAGGLMTMQQTAKALGTGPTRLFDFLRRQHVLTKENVPLQQHLEAKRFQVKTGVYYDRGERTVWSRTYVTSKGLAFIGELLASKPASTGGTAL